MPDQSSKQSQGPFGLDGWLALLVAILCILVYWPALGGGFVWLDHFEIVQGGMLIETWAELPQRFFDTGNYAGYHRPLYDLMHSLDYALWGQDPFGFHLSSLLLHAINAVLVFLVSRRLGLSPSLRFAIAALWALHPLNSAVAGLIHAKADLLVTCFLLLSGEFFAAGAAAKQSTHRTACLGVGGLAWTAALFTKETAFVLPLLLSLSLPWRDLGAPARRRWAGIVLFLAASAGALLLWRGASVGSFASPLSLTERLATFLHVLRGYISSLGLPTELSIADTTTRWAALPFSDQIAALSTFVLLLLALGTTWKRCPSSRPWVLVFGIFLLPVAQFIPLLHFRAERFLYLPSLGFVGSIVVILSGLSQSYPSLGRWTWTGPLATAATLGLCAYRIHLRLPELQSDESLFRPEITTIPDYREGLGALAADRDRRGDFESATSLHARAIQSDPRRLSYANDATLVVNFSRNLLARREAAQAISLISDFQSSQAGVRPREALLLDYNRGVALHQLGRFEEALPLLEGFATVKQNDASAWFLCGNAARESGQEERAKAAWRRYLQLAPQAPDRAKVQSYLGQGTPEGSNPP